LLRLLNDFTSMGVVAMCTNPLSEYFAFGGANPRFESNCTALWRGHQHIGHAVVTCIPRITVTTVKVETAFSVGLVRQFPAWQLYEPLARWLLSGFNRIMNRFLRKAVIQIAMAVTM